eukprot:TRINITY_DN2457_c0_g1_i1.p1 TRINITY_DN2457_c0_g1~~TRINITY_DN2457_c0_g1_i1.p1  ORF type:complete len:425 (+),score=83.17 TRINITY_DN2457_c0_g1_i1:54-1277(+)
MEDSDIAILSFTLAAFAFMLLMCLWKTRRRGEPQIDEVPLRIKIVTDETVQPAKKKEPTPLETPLVAKEPDQPQAEVDYGEAQTAPHRDVKSAVPKILEEKVEHTQTANIMDRVVAKKKILWMVHRYQNKKAFRKSVAEWKKQESERRKMLKLGKMGSLRVKVGSNMEVVSAIQGGAAEAAGMKTDDLIVLINRTGRGGKVIPVPMPRLTSFLRAVGPQSEVFEGSEIEVVVIRDPSEIKSWAADSSETDSLRIGTPEYVAAWTARVNRRTTVPLKVTVGVDSDNAKKSRRKNMEQKKKDNNLTKLDIKLVEDFLYDPDACAVFVKTVFDKADNDGSGELDASEIYTVFTHMTEVTGVPPPTRKDAERLFSVMDESYDEKVSFEEFFPYFRTLMVKLIMDEIVAVNE